MKATATKKFRMKWRTDYGIVRTIVCSNTLYAAKKAAIKYLTYKQYADLKLINYEMSEYLH